LGGEEKKGELSRAREVGEEEREKEDGETNLDPQLVHCLIATAFTPLLIPAIPSLR